MSIVPPKSDDVQPPRRKPRRGADEWRADDLTPEFVQRYRTPLLSRFTVADLDACWTWQGSITPQGYGAFAARNGRAWVRRLVAHRAVYVLLTNRPLLDQLTLDHLCRNKACVNPRHLEPVTLAENSKRANPRVDPEQPCIRGHAPNRFPRRSDGKAGNCRDCVRDRNREYEARRRPRPREQGARS